MTTVLDASSAMALMKAHAPLAPAAAANAQAANKAARQFEASFVSELLGQMFENIPTDGPFGGGPGEEMFRSFMIDEYGKQIEQQGGFGLAAPVARQLLQLQEMRS
jgi:peptidoglycan hydrolase FlgJ